MTETRTARQIAEHIIRDAATDIDWGDIGDMTEDEAKALDEEAYDRLRREVDDLISKADVTVTFPGDGDPEAEVRAKVAEEIETTIGGYPDNGAMRPKVERGGHMNDAAWAARIARGEQP